jgi:hypothetical protein
MRVCIRYDVLEKDEDVVGRTRDQRWVCGGAGQREGLTLWHTSVHVSYNRALHCVSKCTTTLSEAGRGCGSDAGCACRHEHPVSRKSAAHKCLGALSSGIAWDESCQCGISIAKGSLYKVCQLGDKGMEQRWDETMGQAAIRCTDRKLPGSC